MRTRQFWGVTAASLALTLWSVGAGWCVERQLVGIVLGRSYKTVLAKYGNPDLMVPIYVPVGSLLQATGGGTGLDAGGLGFPGGAPGGYPGAPGMGGPGAGYGGPGGMGGPPGMGGPGAGYGGPGGVGGPPGMGGPGSPYGGPGGAGYGGPPGMSGGSPYGPGGGGPGGPPVLPPGGGEAGGGGYGAPGGPGGYGGAGGGDASGGSVLIQGNAVKWVYLRPGGMSYEFWINEDGRVAQIAVTGKSGNAVTSKGIRLGSSYSDVLNRYGPAEVNRYSTVAPDVAIVMGLNQKKEKSRALGKKATSGFGQLFGAAFQGANVVTDVIYTRSHHTAFTLVDGRVSRITIALAD